VVDFMALLKQSIDTKRRTPAKKAVPVKKTAKKAAPKRAAKKTAAKAPSPKRRKSA
jgi:DNA end-binding protein Ku